MNLTTMLDQASPTVSERTTELRVELHDLASAAEASARVPRRRFGVRLGIAGGVALGAVGVTAGAGMAGVIPGFRWVPWHTEAGTACHFSTEPLAGGDVVPTSPDPTWPTVEDTRLALAAARRILGSFDYGSIDVDQAIEQYQQLPDQPVLTGDDLELTAVNAYVTGVVDERLEKQGLDPRAVIYVTRSRCDQ